jgi:predicted Na+-dependent transporter
MHRSDVILGVLVLAVAVTIDPARLTETRSAWRVIVAAALLPIAVLLSVAVALGALYGDAPHDGLVALGLAPSEVASAGLVALAGGDAVLALAVVTVSLVVTAVAAPVLAPLLVDSNIDAGDLIGRFSLVVLVPLVVGLAVRSLRRDERLETWGGMAATPVLALLVYAASEISAIAPRLAARCLWRVDVLFATAASSVLGRAREPRQDGA